MSKAYDPQKHHRRSIRLRGFDYSQPGAYFVTVVVQGRRCLLGEVENDQMRLSSLGRIVERCWQDIDRHFLHVGLDRFVVMPNHIHTIVLIDDGRRGEAFKDGALRMAVEPPLNASPLPRPRGTEPGSLGAVIQTFKSISARKVHQASASVERPFWQRNYYEHIIRDEEELSRLRDYVVGNPATWAADSEHPESAPGRSQGNASG